MGSGPGPRILTDMGPPWAQAPHLYGSPWALGWVGAVGRLGGVESNHRMRSILEREYFPPATHYISAPKLQNPPLGYQSYYPGIRNFIIEHEVPNF